MTLKLPQKRRSALTLLASVVALSFAIPAYPLDTTSLLAVGPSTIEYATNTVKPALDSCSNVDGLSLLLKLSDILTDPEKGIGAKKLDPKDFFVYDILERIHLGFLYALTIPSGKRPLLRRWHDRYMKDNPADVLFAPSADEIIGSRAAFGCTHYARAFMAVAKALDLVKNPEDLRYVISCRADDYSRAREEEDREKTINGHQFVLARIDSEWIAINTSKGESTAMADAFSPASFGPPRNIPMRFESYPGVVLLIRRIGMDYNDDCGDDSLTALMNISRSGDPQEADFLWEKFVSRN